VISGGSGVVGGGRRVLVKRMSSRRMRRRSSEWNMGILSVIWVWRVARGRLVPR
jgi:hypothetical protein